MTTILLRKFTGYKIRKPSCTISIFPHVGKCHATLFTDTVCLYRFLRHHVEAFTVLLRFINFVLLLSLLFIIIHKTDVWLGFQNHIIVNKLSRVGGRIAYCMIV